MTSASDRDHKLYELNWAFQEDIRSPEPAGRDTFEEFQKVWERSNLVQDALDSGARRGHIRGNDGVLVESGRCRSVRSRGNECAAPYCRRGIAMTLKLRGMEFAQERGIRDLWTRNASDNGATLAVNRRLGYVRRPAQIVYFWDMRGERPKDGILTLGGQENCASVV